MDPLSISASIAGLISITDMIASKSYKYIKEARGASKEVKKLLEEITDLFGILNSLRLVAARYQEEHFDSTMQSQHIHTCHALLEKIKYRLDKADPSQVDENKTAFRQKASTFGRTLVWPFTSAETKALIAEVADQKATLSLALAADGMTTLIESLSQQKAQGEDIAEIRENIRAQRAEQALTLLSQERRRMLDTIGPFDPSGHQKIAIKLRQPGTGVWFTEGPQFQHWLETPKSKLWLYGIPGAGKTVLASSIVQAVCNKSGQSNGIAYFYCDYKDPKTHDPLIILGSLVRQLAIQDSRSLGALEKFYIHHFEESGATTGHSMTPEDLCSLIQSSSGFFDEVMIIIDALDECGSDRSKVMELLASLNGDGFNIKTLFTSRLETDIELHLGDYEKISIAATSSDLKLYVASEIESRSRKKTLRTRDPELKKEIMDRLVDGAEGMFRWVACQLDYLCELNTDKALRRALDSLPPTLFATYERILDRVNASNHDTQQLVQRVLTWIVCSKRPLSTNELLEAVSITKGDTELDVDAMPDEEGILKWCSSLVRRTPDGDKLELAHFTVEEFLLAIDSNDPNSHYAKYRISPIEQDLNLAKLCLTYLEFEDFQGKDWEGVEELHEFTEEYSFFDYASVFWDEHAFDHRDDEELLELMRMLFDPSKSGNFLCWSRYWMWERGSTDDIQELSNSETLHFAATLSFDSICRWLIEEKGRIGDLEKLSILGTPLFCALAGPDDSIRLDDRPNFLSSYAEPDDEEDNRRRVFFYLLEAGAKIDHVKVHPAHDWSPLCLALRLNFGWETLLEKGAFLDETCFEVVEDFIQSNRSDLASRFLLTVKEENLGDDIRSRYVNEALKLEETRQQAADMMSKANGRASSKISFSDSSALRKAAMVGQIRVVRELLDQPDIDIDFRDPKSDSRTALHSACHSGHLEVVKVLVGNGATIDIEDRMGMTPFHRAAGAESLEIVQYMEEHGADINKLTGDGCNVLHLSARGDSTAILEHLLRSSQLVHSISSRSINGQTALHCAVEAGSLDTARFILERSSKEDILSKSHDGHTCLHYAVLSDSPKMLGLFQDSGICHRDQTKSGYTALHFAAESSPMVMKTLLDHIDRTTLLPQNPFEYPVLIGGCSTIQDQHGVWMADDFMSGRQLDTKTKDGKTALQLLISTDPFMSQEFQLFKDLILRDGIDLEKRDREKKTPLVALASRLSNDCGNLEIRHAISALLGRGVNPNAQDMSGRTALHYLCNPNYFATAILQAIVDLIGVEGWLKEIFTAGGPPPPPPGYRGPPVIVQPGKAPKRRMPGVPPPPPPPGARMGSPPMINIIREELPPPPPSTIKIIREGKSTPSCKKFGIARVDILDETKETALQAFFRNLNRAFNGTTPLEIAVRMLDLSPKTELDRGLPNGDRLFNIAIIFKNDTLIKKLYDLGVDTKERDSTLKLMSPLECFCIYGARETEVLNKLIADCTNLSELDNRGLSLLHLACEYGHLKVVQALLDGGINVDLESWDRVTALSHAVAGGHIAIAEVLLEHNASTDTARAGVSWRASLLSRAPNVTMCRLLEDRGVNDWTQRTNCTFETLSIPHFSTNVPGRSYVQMYISRLIHQLTPLHHVAYQGHHDIFKYVVEHIEDIDVDVKAEFGVTPLFLAIISQKPTLVRFLLSQGAKPNNRYMPLQWTMLHLAASIGNTEIASDLLANEANPCAKDRSSLTPSIIALQMHHLNLCDMLETAEKSASSLDRTKSIDVKECYISPALVDAIVRGELALCKQLIQRGFSIDGTCECGCTALLKAWVHSRQQVAAYLLSIGATVEGQVCKREHYSTGFTTLHFAASYGNDEFLEKILEKDPQIPQEGLLPVHLAARNGHAKVLRILLEKSKDGTSLLAATTDSSKSLKGHRGRYQSRGLGSEIGRATPLHFAAKYGHLDAVEYLLRSGADLESRDEEGLTAIQHAVGAAKFRDLLQLLISAGANLNTRDNEGKTPLMRAAFNWRSEVVKYLIAQTKNGLDLHARDISGHTALHLAIDSREAKAAKRLIAAGLDAAYPEWSGACAIQWALLQNSYSNNAFPVEKLLLPDIDILRSSSCGSILNTAVFSGNEKIMMRLLEKVKEGEGEEYINFRCDFGTALYCAAFRGNLRMMKALVEKGARVNGAQGPLGSPLMATCAIGLVDTVIWLLRNSAELECTKLDGTVVNAEEAAVQHENVVSLIERFRERGVVALDEEVPGKKADMARMEECLVGFKERDEKGVEVRLFSDDSSFVSSSEEWTSEFDSDSDSGSDGKDVFMGVIGKRHAALGAEKVDSKEDEEEKSLEASSDKKVNGKEENEKKEKKENSPDASSDEKRDGKAKDDKKKDEKRREETAVKDGKKEERKTKLLRSKHRRRNFSQRPIFRAEYVE